MNTSGEGEHFDIRGREKQGDLRISRNEVLQILYSSPPSKFLGIITSRRMRLEWHVENMGEIRNAHKILFGICGKKGIGITCDTET